MWTKQQRDCMAALGMPVYEFVGTNLAADGAIPDAVEAEVSVPDTAFSDPIQSVPDNTYTDPFLYRLGPWCLKFPEALPAGGCDWLQDLARFIGGNPVQVSHTPESMTAIDCAPFFAGQLTPEQKRELWNQLKPALNS